MAALLPFPAFAQPPAPPEYRPEPALIDLRTTFSDGEYDPDTLVQMAFRKGFQIVIFNDHEDRKSTRLNSSH